MRLDLREIIEIPGGSVPFSCELETEGLDFPSVLAYRKKPYAEGRVYNEAGILHLTGTLTAEMTCICDRCGEVLDLPAQPLPESIRAEVEAMGAQVTGYTCCLHGVCQICQSMEHGNIENQKENSNNSGGM